MQYLQFSWDKYESCGFNGNSKILEQLPEPVKFVEAHFGDFGQAQVILYLSVFERIFQWRFKSSCSKIQALFHKIPKSIAKSYMIFSDFNLNS